MRKNLFLWAMLALVVLVLILAFENITTSGTFLLLFYEIELSMTLVVFLCSFLGFLIGFFAMLYSYEKGREQEEVDHDEAVASAPAVTVEKKDAKEMAKATENVKIDKFDEDEEVLE